MAITTYSDICQSALKEINVLAAGETMTAEDADGARDNLNLLIDQWAAQRLQIYSVTRTTFTITSGVNTYLVAPAAVVNIARPVYVEHVNYIDTSLSIPLERQMFALTDDAYAALPLKTLTAVLPTSYYYNPTFPSGTLILWPTPTSATLQGAMYAATAIAQAGALTDSLSMPPGYKRMMVKNLAVDLAYSYGREVSESLKDAAEESLRAVKVANIRLMDMRIDSSALGQANRYWWDIRVGP